MQNISYAQNAYRSIDIGSLSPLDLIIKLYDGAISFLSKAALGIEKKDKIAKINYINKTRMILEELLSSLNVEAGGEVALHLRDLYTYMIVELTRANANNSIDKVYHVQELMRTLKSAWQEIKITNTPVSESYAIKSINSSH
ncbi:flagellar export chaperone FliS [Candidatus Magnetomonas plexicatena]|uniref:flagellar export chaperone FliS n=1 Tax=Candidatus Magnetomonas plexicatena TaxID=2552947 RepID=UPI00110209F9|nr:flagellar export chaperone FliS [Nitrospirales bacterium LBB_01]